MSDINSGAQSAERREKMSVEDIEPQEKDGEAIGWQPEVNIVIAGHNRE
jgi:hypothetical protein